MKYKEIIKNKRLTDFEELKDYIVYNQSGNTIKVTNDGTRKNKKNFISKQQSDLKESDRLLY